MLDDMRRDRDAWRDQAQARVLPAPGAKMSWRRWSRITGWHRIERPCAPSPRKGCAPSPRLSRTTGGEGCVSRRADEYTARWRRSRSHVRPSHQRHHL